MKTKHFCKFLSIVLALCLLLTVLPLPARAESTTYVLDVGELESFGKNTKADGDSVKAGTNGYFTVFFSTSAQVQDNVKSFSDGFNSSKRLHYGAATKMEDPVRNAIQIKTSGPATVKVWWGCGDVNRQVGIYLEDGTVVTKTADELKKNDLCISELSIDAAGTYYIGNVGGNNYHYKIEVTEENSGASQPDRAAWSSVAKPVITGAVDTGDGEIAVTVSANVGYDGGDEVEVTMFDSEGQAIISRNSVMERDSHTIRFIPEGSGDYIFKAVLKREGEQDKAAEQSVTAAFTLPLERPTVLSATSAGGGKITVAWVPVLEAESYEILCDDVPVGTTTASEYTVSGLIVGQKYSFRVVAIRGAERVQSGALSAIATEQAQRPWSFITYGESTSPDYNGYAGNLNEDGYVTIFSENGKGKITSTTDGVAFYYTAVPTNYNFTLRAKVTVDAWTYSNGQEGFGLLATDRLGVNGDSAPFWNNQFMACATKIEYCYESGSVYDVNGPGTKYSMKLGLGSIAKTGLTAANLPLVEQNDANAMAKFLYQMHTLEWAAGEWELDKGTYNIVGNCTNESSTPVGNVSLTTFILEIQKNNTGYFITYYDEDGNILCRNKYYGADALNQLDPDYVYVGFFTARNAEATFSEVEFATILCTEDAPAEEKPMTQITPTISIASGSVTTKDQYTLFLDANVDGTVKITDGNTVIAEADVIEGEVRFRKTFTLEGYGEHRIKVEFTPDPNQDLGEDTVLSTTQPKRTEITVVYNKGNYHRTVIYVSPTGLPNGNGTREYPYDIQTAVDNVVPGQTIILMEGTYKMTAPLRIQRGMDGTEEKMISMIADPEAATRPVLDFQQRSAGIIHGGNYWYFFGFDVTNSQNGQKGFQVSGSYNILDQIHTYRNGNTGVQISRLSGKDLFEDWPAYNLILNCDSYYNMDSGFEDADGFAAKLTCGEGNVFDGCVAYHNADDGWDLYAKVETGPIGTVTIRNCIAYANGYIEGYDDTGNGNGFKLGGEGIPGRHVLENSFAFFNLSKGIDSNSCPDVIVRNCISYNNGSHNVAFYTKKNANTDFIATGIISFKDATNPVNSSLTGEKLDGIGTQDPEAYMGSTNYYWNGSACVNAAGQTLNADIFVSLEFTGITRNSDGTFDLQGFLELTDAAPDGAGATEGGAVSGPVEIPEENGVHNYSEVWFSEDNMYHWRECECGDRADMGEHTLEWITDKEATPTETGLRHEQCSVCGHKKPAVTVYYEDPNAPTDPTEPTQPSDPSNPQPTDPGDTQPTDPAKPDEPSGNGLVIAIVIVAIVLAGGAVAVVLPRKKK